MELEPGELELICTCVGQIIVPFALLEASLNAIVEATYQHFGGNKLEKELPQSLKKRVLYLEKCLLKLPILMPVKDDLQKLLNTTLDEADTRNKIAHGFMAAFERSTTTITFKSLEAKTDKQKHTIQISSYTIPELLDCGGRIQNAASSLNEMAYRVLRLSAPY